MEHVSSVHPTGKFPEKVENLKRWARFPGWNFPTEFRVPFTRFYQFQVHGNKICRASRRIGVYDQMEQLFTNRKFHFCSHPNFRVFFLNGKRTQCFITRWNTEKRVENMMRSAVFLTNFEVFHLVIKHRVECLILLLKQNDVRQRN